MEKEISQEIAKNLDEDILELYSFIEESNHPYKEDLLFTLKNKDNIQEICVVILKITQAFSITAFSLKNRLHDLREPMETVFKKLPILKELIPIYLFMVDLKDINEDIDIKTQELQKKKLEDFLLSFD